MMFSIVIEFIHDIVTERIMYVMLLFFDGGLLCDNVAETDLVRLSYLQQCYVFLRAVTK